MKFLAIEHECPGIAADQFQPLLKLEARCAWELVQAGTIREIYFRVDRHEAVIMLEYGSEEEARQLLSSLPLVQAGLIEFEVIPLVPYDGFSRLFS